MQNIDNIDWHKAGSSGLLLLMFIVTSDHLPIFPLFNWFYPLTFLWQYFCESLKTNCFANFQPRNVLPENSSTIIFSLEKRDWWAWHNQKKYFICPIGMMIGRERERKLTNKFVFRAVRSICLAWGKLQSKDWAPVTDERTKKANPKVEKKHVTNWYSWEPVRNTHKWAQAASCLNYITGIEQKRKRFFAWHNYLHEWHQSARAQTHTQLTHLHCGASDTERDSIQHGIIWHKTYHR